MRFRRRGVDPLDVSLPYRPPEPVTDPPLFPEPWRHHHLAGEVMLVPVAILLRIADPSELARICRRESDRLNWIRDSVAIEGFREPLSLAIDAAGRICMNNGHHRLIVAEDLGIERLPVHFVRSGRVRMRSVPACDVVGPLLSSPAPDVRMRRAVEFALAAIEDAGERGWALGDAVCALRLALGRDVHPDALARMATIDSSLVIASAD